MRKLLFLLLGLALPLQASTLQSKRYFENSGGLIDHISPLLIPDNKASALQNITLDDRGQLSKRKGYSIINSTGAMGLAPVTGGGYHTATSGSSFFAVIAGSNVYKTGNTFSGTYTNITGTVTVTNSASNLAQTTSLNDSLIFCNERDKPFKVSSTGNAVHLSTGLFSGAKTCSTYGTYLILSNTTESSVSFPSRVRWSDINTPDSFPANNYIDVEPNDGDPIIASIAFEDSVYIFKKKSIHRMMITGLDGADAFIIRPVVRNIGAWAKNSVKVIPNVGIAFLAQNTVYVLNDDGLNPIGDSIQRTLDAVTRSMWANSVGVVYPQRYQYWLAISPSGSTNSKVLVYDYIQKSWTVYTGMSVNMLSQAEDSNGNALLLSGDYVGNNYQQDHGTSDNPAAVSTSIDASYTTGDLYIDTPEITKNFKYLYLFTQVDLTTTVTIDAYFDYDSTAISYSNPLSLGQVGAVYDTAVYDTDIYPSTLYKVSRLEINRSAKAMKLRFSNSSTDSIVGVIGWVVVYSQEDYRQ